MSTILAENKCEVSYKWTPHITSKNNFGNNRGIKKELLERIIKNLEVFFANL